jgi:hypothetical protein
MKRFFTDNNLLTFDLLHNNAYIYQNIAVCGTRGWFYEEETHTALDSSHSNKMINREVIRLRVSLDAGIKQGGEPVVFLHYPPLYEGYRCDPLVTVLEEYSVKRCFFGHLHGHARSRAIEGEYRGVDYRLVSADHLGFKPLAVTGGHRLKKMVGISAES